MSDEVRERLWLVFHGIFAIAAFIVMAGCFVWVGLRVRGAAEDRKAAQDACEQKCSPNTGIWEYVDSAYNYRCHCDMTKEARP